MFPVSIGVVTARGFWVDLGDQRVFAAYRDFPWFREFTRSELAGVRRPAKEHLRWAAFDIDLELDALLHPERYPLVEKRLRGAPALVIAQLRKARRSLKRPRVAN